VSEEVASDEVELPAPTPLLHPAAGVPEIIETEEAFSAALRELAAGTGPYAFDAERASGFKYSARAYLIQIKRTNGGLHLIDPIPFGPHHPCFIQLNSLISNEEVILHASTQDLPCLRELGIEPQILFDTELGGRIAGLPRVGLGPLLETLMGVSLAKEHSAADWSKRPLPTEWLNYAALDVELLVELRDKVYQLLVDAGKWEWAQEDFASIISAPPPPARIDPWRRTSGMHKIKKRLHMAVVRELWQTRNTLAQELDISPGRLLTDAAISEIALASENTPMLNRKHLEKVLRPIGLRARWFENSELWITSIASALALTFRIVQRSYPYLWRISSAQNSCGVSAGPHPVDRSQMRLSPWVHGAGRQLSPLPSWRQPSFNLSHWKLSQWRSLRLLKALSPPNCDELRNTGVA